MIVRCFSGRTVAEALGKVREHLGDKALIIETRPVKLPGLLGGRSGYEVVAAGDDLGDAAPAPAPAPAAAPTPPAPAAEDPRRDWGLLQGELAAIRRQLARLADGRDTPRARLGDDLARRLQESELPEEHLAELDEAVGQAGERLDAAARSAFCARVLERSLDRVRPLDWNQCRRLLMVGPTGVGKTTTIAKIAGDLVLNQRRSVALLTIDTYRVGGQDQLKAYADLLDVPCEVCVTPAQLAEAIARHGDRDHILIDSAGRSPADAARVHELKGFCRAAPGLSVMLCAAATAGRAEFAAVVERFSILPIEHACITKLDECAAPGRLYGCLRRHRLPVRLVTTGQEVPADIQVAEAGALAARVLEAAGCLC